MAVALGGVLAGITLLAWRPLWGRGSAGKTACIVMVLFVAALFALLVVERIEAMGEYR